MVEILKNRNYILISLIKKMLKFNININDATHKNAKFSLLLSKTAILRNNN